MKFLRAIWWCFLYVFSGYPAYAEWYRQQYLLGVIVRAGDPPTTWPKIDSGLLPLLPKEDK